MYLADYHTHSVCSPDGSAPMLEMALAAVRAGMDELCVTDHVDLLDGAGREITSYDWPRLEAQYEEALAGVPGGFTLRLGIEMGGGQEFPDRAAEWAGRAELDFVIGSVHNRPRDILGGEDLFYGRYINTDVCYKALDGYFASLAEVAAQTGSYDVLGHIIYPLRYMRDRDGQNVSLKRYYPQIEAMMKVAAGSGKGMEVNTWRGRTLSEWGPILHMFRRAGGEIVTLGSDAHTPRDVGKGIADGAAVLLGAGFKYYATYEKHRPKMHKLSG